MRRNPNGFFVSQDNINTSNLFIGGVPWECSEKQLVDFLTALANRQCVLSLRIDRRNSSHCAFVRIDTNESLQQILASNNVFLSGSGRSTIRLERSRGKEVYGAIAPWQYNPYSLSDTIVAVQAPTPRAPGQW